MPKMTDLIHLVKNNEGKIDLGKSLEPIIVFVQAQIVSKTLPVLVVAVVHFANVALHLLLRHAFHVLEIGEKKFLSKTLLQQIFFVFFFIYFLFTCEKKKNIQKKLIRFSKYINPRQFHVDPSFDLLGFVPTKADVI